MHPHPRPLQPDPLHSELLDRELLHSEPLHSGPRPFPTSPLARPQPGPRLPWHALLMRRVRRAGLLLGDRASRPGRPRTEGPGRPPGPARPTRSALAVLCVAAGAAMLTIAEPTPVALAQVVHGQGFSATVLGWSSWYGSYELGALGAGWCIDHGLQAPDAEFGYVPAPVSDAAPETRAAMAWLVSQPATGPVEHAARMLALHDLMGASYPFGRLDVDTLTPTQMSGFGGGEHAVIAAARAAKAYGLSHATWSPPFTMTLGMTRATPGTPGDIGVAVLDADGHRVPGVPISVALTGATGNDPLDTVTGADGVGHVGFVAGPGPVTASARATVPVELSAWASSTAVAQRIVRSGTAEVDAADSYAPPTTTTTAPSTTTTRPPTTTTTAPSTTTTRPPTTTTTAPSTTTTAPSTTSTTRAPTTTTTQPPSTTTTAPSTTSTTRPVTTQPPSTQPPTSQPPTTAPPTPPGAPPRPTLPRTGARDTAGMTMVAIGLILGGAALRDEARRRQA